MVLWRDLLLHTSALYYLFWEFVLFSVNKLAYHPIWDHFSPLSSHYCASHVSLSSIIAYQLPDQSLFWFAQFSMVYDFLRQFLLVECRICGINLIIFCWISSPRRPLPVGIRTPRKDNYCTQSRSSSLMNQTYSSWRIRPDLPMSVEINRVRILVDILQAKDETIDLVLWFFSHLPFPVFLCQINDWKNMAIYKGNIL